MVTTRSQQKRQQSDSSSQESASPEGTPDQPSFTPFTPKMGRLLTPAAKKTLSRVTDKASQSLFQVVSCSFALILCGICEYLTLSMEGDGKNIVGIVCAVFGCDMIISLLFYTDQLPETFVLCSEAASNASQLFLFLSQVGATENGIILFVSGASVVIFAVQLRYRNNQKWWTRFAVYSLLFFNFALNWNSLETHVRLRIFATLVDVALILDIFDLPDALSEVVLCDGLITFLRSLGLYFLVTHSILQANGQTMFDFEQKVIGSTSSSAASSTGSTQTTTPQQPEAATAN